MIALVHCTCKMCQGECFSVTISDFETFSNNFFLLARNSLNYVWFLGKIITFVFYLEEEMKKRGGAIIVQTFHGHFIETFLFLAPTRSPWRANLCMTKILRPPTWFFSIDPQLFYFSLTADLSLVSQLSQVYIKHS